MNSVHKDKCLISQVTLLHASTFMCSGPALMAPGPVAGKLPLELLIKVFNSLPGLLPIAVCACVSRHWRRAAAWAVPKSVTFKARHGKELSQLLTKSCSLGAVESVFVFIREQSAFTRGALFACICAEATCLREVYM